MRYYVVLDHSTDTEWMTMFKKIAAVQTIDDTELVVWFADGEARLFDVTKLIRKNESFAVLADKDVCASVRLAAEGYGISWGEDLDVGCKEILDMSEQVDLVDSESMRVVSEVVDARHEKGLSQARLASAAGVKQPVVARLETGVNSPRLDTLLKVLTPLGKSLQVVDLADTVDADKIAKA